MTSVYGPSCDRTRALLSRQLDAPLSELERRSVAIHAARCAACRAFERDSRWITEELRAAPMAPVAWPLTIMVARRSFPTRLVANLSSAAAVLVVALMAVTAAADVPEDGARKEALATDLRLEDPLHEIRREGLRTGELLILPVDTRAGVKPALP